MLATWHPPCLRSPALRWPICLAQPTHPASSSPLCPGQWADASLIGSTGALPGELPGAGGRGEDWEGRSVGAGRARMPGSHLNILDPVPISVIIALVPHTIVISIFLPRVWCQKAVVLKVSWLNEWGHALLERQPCPHAHLAPTLLPSAPVCSACCCPCRAAPGPGSHRCLCQAHTRSRSQPSPRYTGAMRKVAVRGLGWLSIPAFPLLQALFSPTSSWAQAPLPSP